MIPSPPELTLTNCKFVCWHLFGVRSIPKRKSSSKWRNFKISHSMSYVLSASEWSYTVTIILTVTVLSGPMCSWRFFLFLRWLSLFTKWSKTINSSVFVRASVIHTCVMYKYLVVLCLLCIINSSSRHFNTNCVMYGHVVLFTFVFVVVSIVMHSSWQFC